MKEGLEEHMHNAWSEWVKYLLDTCIRHPDGSVTISSEVVTRWERRAGTLYNALTEKDGFSGCYDADQLLKVQAKKRVGWYSTLCCALYLFSKGREELAVRHLEKLREQIAVTIPDEYP